MRLGGPVLEECSDPDLWIAGLQRRSYRAAYCPPGLASGDSRVAAFVRAAAQADIVIAEVGAWSNPLSPDPAQRKTALAHCQAQLALADELGACCCVNIAGSRDTQWDGPHPLNLACETFDMIVETVRSIIDAVHPRHTYFALETMPWIFPDSPASYAALIEAIDRQRFGVHLDPVNLVSSPQRFFDTASLIRDCFRTLGPSIKSVHAKDIALSTKLTVHLDEVRPGLGGLDYSVLLQEMAKLDPDTPIMLEHLSTDDDYVMAATHIRGVAAEVGVSL